MKSCLFTFRKILKQKCRKVNIALLNISWHNRKQAKALSSFKESVFSHKEIAAKGTMQ